MGNEILILIATNDLYLKAFGQVWWSCFKYYWPDSNCPVMFVTPKDNPYPELPCYVIGENRGWNRNLLDSLTFCEKTYNPSAVILLHEDYLIGPQKRSSYFNDNLNRCQQILNENKDIQTIGLIHKDPETHPYQNWPEMLGYHDVETLGILPVDVGGVSLWRASSLRKHIERVISIVPQERDMGRNGAAEFSYYGSLWSREEKQIHLRVKRGIAYCDGLLNILYGVTIELGRLRITDAQHLIEVERALGKGLGQISTIDSITSSPETLLNKN